MKFRCIFELSASNVYKNVLGAFSQFLRPKTKLLSVKFKHILEVLCLQVLRKSCGRNSMICVSKNEAVCCEVQTHSGSFRLASFVKKLWVHFPDLCIQKRSCLL